MPEPSTIPAPTPAPTTSGPAIPRQDDGPWAQAWRLASRHTSARLALAWLAVVTAGAAFAPFLSSGHPIVSRAIDAAGGRGPWISPLARHLTTIDWCLGAWGLTAGAALVWPAPLGRHGRARALASMLVQGGVTLGLLTAARAALESHRAPNWARWAQNHNLFPLIASVVAALVPALVLLALGSGRRGWRDARILVVALVTVGASWGAWTQPLEAFPYRELELAGRLEAVCAPNPFSPFQRIDGLALAPPLTPSSNSPPAPRVICGTDGLGRDVLAQLLHACRLAISIGLVSTGIATGIGVVVGALMGYFRGWVDSILQRVIEVFMALPVLFLLIAATALLPRHTYVLMAVIGLCTWHGAARFTRAEFRRIRQADFIDAARAAGVPLRAVLFRHLLPNAVTPVLVDAGFGISAAILAEATLSFLSLGPEHEASWGRLLADATDQTGGFVWWLAVFPGVAIFLTALSYNTLAESLRLALDPRSAQWRNERPRRYDPRSLP